MKFLRLIPILFIVFGFFPSKNLVFANTEDPSSYKVLSNKKKFSIANVEYYIEKGDKFIESGDFDKAKASYLDARELATNLGSYYLDLTNVFKRVDARIPNETRKKGKASLEILAKSNERLISLYIKNDQPEVAVPLLIENLRILTPNSPEGKEAYKTLIQLGFVETEYKGG